MTNKVNLKKDIITADQLSRQIKDKDYPTELLDITFELTRITSNLTKLSKLEIQTIFDLIFDTIISKINKTKIHFITQSVEVETVDVGNHIVTFRVNAIGKDIRQFRPELNDKLERTIIDKMGGDLILKHKHLDKTSLMIELIPLQLDLLSFITSVNSNKADKVFYSDDILKYIFDGLKIHPITRTK